MKKIFFGAAVATMMFASCQNDMIESVEQQGRMFTLEVNQGGSRTALDGLQTVWSKGDQIYVTSEDGQTTGVLTLIGEGGEAGGKFSGFVFGNGELKYSVYPVPTKPVDLGKANVERLDAPMTGTISGGATTFNHACGFVRLNLLGIDNNDKVNIAGGQVGSVLEYDLATNTWKKKTEASKITVVEAEDAETFYVPVYVDPTAAAATIDLTITINNETEGAEMKVKPQVSKVNPVVQNFVVTEDGVKDIATADPKDLGDDYIYVTTEDDLYSILGTNNRAGSANDGAYIVLQKGIHNIDNNNSAQLAITKDLKIIGEDGAVIEGGYTPSGGTTRPFYVYCGAVESLEIKNLTFSQTKDKSNKVELWFSGSEPNYMKNEPDCTGETKILFEKVNVEQVRLEGYYIENKVLTAEVVECNVGTFVLEAWKKLSESGYNTFVNFIHDDASQFEIEYGGNDVSKVNIMKRN